MMTTVANRSSFAELYVNHSIHDGHIFDIRLAYASLRGLHFLPVQCAALLIAAQTSMFRHFVNSQ